MNNSSLLKAILGCLCFACACGFVTGLFKLTDSKESAPCYDSNGEIQNKNDWPQGCVSRDVAAFSWGGIFSTFSVLLMALYLVFVVSSNDNAMIIDSSNEVYQFVLYSLVAMFLMGAAGTSALSIYGGTVKSNTRDCNCYMWKEGNLIKVEASDPYKQVDIVVPKGKWYTFTVWLAYFTYWGGALISLFTFMLFFYQVIMGRKSAGAE